MKKSINLIVAFWVFIVVSTINNKLQAQCNIITTVAGTGTIGFSGDGGTATAAELTYPSYVVFDDSDNMYICDQNNNRIRKVTQSGIISTIAGTGTASYGGDGGAATMAQLSAPSGITFALGELYIADGGNNRIRKISPTGIICTIAGTGVQGYSGDGGPATAAKLNEASFVAVDLRGNVYISDKYNYRIRKVDTAGMITTIAGLGTLGFSGDGGAATAAKLNLVGGIDIDSSGNIYFSDIGNLRVRKVTPSGIISTVAGTGAAGFSGDGGPATAAQINYGEAVTVDHSGNLYIPEFAGNRVRKVDISGIISTIVGTGSQGYSGDGGPATAAELHTPTGVGLDSHGNIYIADILNHRIRKVAVAPIIIAAISGSSTVSIGSTISLSTTTTGGGWSSSNTSIATVNSSGLVTGVNLGVDTITYAITSICDSATSMKIITVTSFVGLFAAKYREPSISLYPNPASKDITLEANCISGETIRIQCYSLMGQLVFERNELVLAGHIIRTLDLGELQPGMYQIILLDKTGQRNVRRLVRE